jgi:MarR family transcriptional regulator, organic hydroperoxide resistance regulator
MTKAQATPRDPSKAAPRRRVATEASAEAAPAVRTMEHDLENAIPYLLARAGTRMGQAFSKELRRFNLSLTEWRVCVALHKQSHRRLNELALHTSSDASTLSRVIDKLINDGLVLRDRHDQDGRAVALSLTQAGVSMTERIIPLAQLYERVSMTGVTAEEAKVLRSVLEKLYDNIAALDQIE